jgi:ABC-2 type transport system ATP-binding protein
MIKVKHLTKHYGKFAAVKDISFAVSQGSIFGFVGPNGAGKTTSLRIMATLMAATSGEIEIAGQSVAKNPRRIRHLLGYMPDFFGVYDDLRVNEYLEFYGEASGIPIADVRRDIPDLLELVGLEEKSNSYVNNLSRGMKQRLCLARALVHRPEVLLLDEPASGLDPRARVELRNILKELQQMGKTIIISSHILAELAQVCTHVGIINNGTLPLCAPISEVLARIQGDAVIEISVADRLDEARMWLLEQQGVKDVGFTNAGNLEAVFAGDREAQGRLLREMVNRFTLYAFTPGNSNLEQLFMEITEVRADV